MSRSDPCQLTNLGRYLDESGTVQSWLAECVGVTPTKVSRWALGISAMRDEDKRKVLQVLRERAEMSLDDLFDDQPEFRQPRSPARVRGRVRRNRGVSPYDRLLSQQLAGYVAESEL